MSRFQKTRRSPADQLHSTRRTAGLASDTDAARNRANWRQRSARRAPTEAVPDDPTRRDSPLARLEAVLFLAREPLSTRKLAQLANLADGTEARTLVRRLNGWYDQTQTAFRAEEVAGGYQLLTRPQLGTWLARLHRGGRETRLSAPALETLAVVAYRQPVVRAEIDAVRGVDCGEILRQLMDRDLVRTAGRADELGRPYLYATTKRFMQVFGLRHLDDLPRAELLRGTTAGQQPTNSSAASCVSAPMLPESVTETIDRVNEEESDRDHHRPA